MWIFLTSGLVMPCEVEKLDKAAAFTLGYRDLQVRGRLTEHLDYFVKHYMDPYGIDHSEVVKTPSHDYTCRFYCTKAAFGAAMTHAVADIDYRHFKDQSTRKDAAGGFVFKCAEVYHSLLIRIWGASLSLAPAGSFYGPWSKSNPDGYKPIKRGKGKKYSWDIKDTTTSSTLDYDDSLWDEDDDEWWGAQAQKDLEYDANHAEDEDSYVPEFEKRARKLLDGVKDLPIRDWADHLNSIEYEDVLYLIEQYPEEYSALALQVKLLCEEIMSEQDPKKTTSITRLKKQRRSPRVRLHGAESWESKYGNKAVV